MKRAISILAMYSSLIMPAMAGDLKVHEWGTFTSFMGSNGELIEGLHHEDEPLPSFVHGLKKEANKLHLNTPLSARRCPTNSKVDCFTMHSLVRTHSELFPEAPISSGVTQKMETPVIYFYGDAETKVTVDINFPQGIITQYYPQASFAYPKFGEAKELKNGRFTFDVTLKNPEDTAWLMNTKAESIWNPARNVPDANVVTISKEGEKFIFYRGIGDFPSPLKVTSDENNVLTLENLSRSNISMAIILHSDGKEGTYRIINNLEKSIQMPVPDLSKGLPFNHYINLTKAAIAEALVKNGLYKDEALAMVNTWEKSYFHTPGTRVLYIVPSVDTEAILPLTVKPAPAELVRVLVGRVEIMTAKEEQHYLSMSKAFSTENFDKEKMFGRFYEPKLRRLEQIASPELKKVIQGLL